MNKNFTDALDTTVTPEQLRQAITGDELIINTPVLTLAQDFGENTISLRTVINTITPQEAKLNGKTVAHTKSLVLRLADLADVGGLFRANAEALDKALSHAAGLEPVKKIDFSRGGIST